MKNYAESLIKTTDRKETNMMDDLTSEQTYPIKSLKEKIQKRIIIKDLKRGFFAFILFLLDVLMLLLSFSIASFIKFDGSFITNAFSSEYIPSFYLTTIIFALSFYFNGLYSFKTYLFWDELKNILKASFFSLVVLIFVSFLWKTYYSRFVLIIGIVIFVLFEFILRYFYRKLLYKYNLFRTNVLIIGAGEMGKIISQKIKAHTFTMYNIIGFLDDDVDKLNNVINDFKVLGTVKDIDEIISKTMVDEVIIAIPTASRRTLSKIISHLEGKVRRIKFTPDTYQLITFSTQIQDLDGVMTISTSQGLLNPANRLSKRIIDIIGAIVGLIILAPLTLYVAIRVRLEDKGPIFFKQKRIGQNGKDIYILKYRSMVVNAEEILFKMMEEDPKIKKEYLTNKKLKNDPRITKVGKFLRNASLDEFPQFVNVLKGEMSLVGPRPYLHREIPDMKESYKSIIKVKPGITGMWQVSGRSDTDFDERLKLDEYYVRNWSLWLDIVIILKTVKAVLDKRGAY